MSTGSYFILLRKSKFNEKIIKDEVDKYINDYNKLYNQPYGYINDSFENQEFFKFPLTLETIQPNYFKWVSFKNYLIYDEIFICNFLSSFTQLREYFNLDPYKKSELIIDFNVANDIKIAIDYLLSRNFSLKIEDIMNNQWIRIFGELLPSYETFLEGKKFTNYNNEEENDGRYILTKLQNVFNTYIWINNENDDDCEYFLIYHVW